MLPDAGWIFLIRSRIKVDGRLHNRLCSTEVAGACNDFVFALSKAITHTMAAGAPTPV